MPFEFKQLIIPEIILIIPKRFADIRGVFAETYKKSDFKNNNIDFEFIQDNYSISKKGVIRGLHYQLNPKAQGKLVRVTNGSLLDIAVDIRKKSPTYGEYTSIVLSSENDQMLWVPLGFAHGFLSLEDNTEFCYKTTQEYSKEHERGINYKDPEINIYWDYKNPIVSEKDSKLPYLKDCENNFYYEGIK